MSETKAKTGRRQFLGTAISAAAALSVAGPRRAFAADDTIRIGYVSHKTGPFAPFAEADDFVLGQVRKAVAGGVVISGKRYNVKIIDRDDQSNPDRQANIAADLINNENVDLMLGQVTAGVGLAQQCELNGVPCVTTMSPWQAWMFPLKGSPEKGFSNIFHFFWGIDDIGKVYLDIWKNVPGKKVVGVLFENTLQGAAMGDPKTGFPAMAVAAGYKVVDLGRFAPGSDDYSNYIQAFKKEGVQIVTGVVSPPDWASFVKQSAQMGLAPAAETVAKALLFPAGVAALGQKANGMSTELWWSPAYPFKSSLTGETARQLADTYQSATKKAWTQPIGPMHALFEVGVQALKSSADPKNPKKVVEAVRNLKMDTIVGRIDFPGSGVKNVSKMRVVGGQWFVNDKGSPEIYITTNGTAPEIPTQRKFELLKA
ncbi:hypothetical protein AWB77_03893 [Caballeronia fortuita]|uniref:Leucine-binding protein domain-containing protein n=1 Tax=Caballeronia fortuita TaxID=1777138 RepID=A0A158CB23_9BURK|nr:ABC transporter substrate-binding protein [Caballeronia fortuita]SAK79573.1 hypothetical protein AWB77_03893 [Caballeronia fortuita]